MLRGLAAGWSAATAADWTRAAADGLEAALRVSDATERYVRKLSLAFGVVRTARVALIAGAGGSPLANALDARLAAAGLRVIHIDARSTGALPGTASSGIDRVSLDTRDAVACRDVTTAIERLHGDIEVLVHVVGHDDVATDNVADRLERVFQLSKSVVDGMSSRGFGRILVVCLAPAGAEPTTGGYREQKAAVLAFSRSLAREVAARGITVNVVTPGPVANAAPHATASDAALVDRIPARRLAEPSDVAHVVGFLAGADAGYVTGADVPVSGGLRL